MGLLSKMFSSDNSGAAQSVTSFQSEKEREFDDLERRLLDLKLYEKNFKQQKEQLFSEVENLLDKYNIDSYNGTYLDMSHVAGRYQNFFDVTAFKEQNPELYQKYLKCKMTKDYIRVK